MTIKEVSQKYHVTEATLRYYEKEKVLFPVTRKNGIRNYEETNLNNLEFVLCMRKAGMSMERLKKYILLFDEEHSEQKRRDILEEQREELLKKIEELTESLKILNYKIEKYENLLHT